ARARVRQTSAASLFRSVAEFGPFQETASGPHQSLCLAELLQQLRVGAAAERPMSPPRDCECPPDPGQGRRADHDCDSDHYLQAQRESYEFAGTPQDTLRQPPQAEHDQQHGQCDDGVASAYRCRGCEPAGRWRWFPQVAIHTSLCHWSRCRAATTIPDAVHRRDKNWFFGNSGKRRMDRGGTDRQSTTLMKTRTTRDTTDKAPIKKVLPEFPGNAAWKGQRKQTNDCEAGGTGSSPDNKQRRCFVLSCPSCPRRVRAFMSVSLSSAGPSLTIQGSYPSLHLTPCFPEIPEEPFFGERRGLNVAACHIGGSMERQIGLAGGALAVMCVACSTTPN